MAQQERPNPEHKQRIGLREFLRGGYHRITEPVVIMNRRKPVAVWTPVPPEEDQDGHLATSSGD